MITNVEDDQMTKYKNETAIQIKFLSTTQSINAKFEGFFREDTLDTQIIGIFTDMTDPKDVIEQKIAFH